MKLLVLCLLLLGCNIYVPDDATPIAPPPEARLGYDRAVECAGRAPVRFEDLRFYSVPGWSFGKNYGGYTVGKDVYVAEGQFGRVWIWAHETMHAFGYHGHPYIFYECNLMAEQN